MLSGVRIYVGGEGRWAKGQKDALYHLHRYATTRDQVSYEHYLTSIKICQADKQFRLALSAPILDRERALEGFVGGRNHPDDFDTAAVIFRWFGWIDFVDAAISIWIQADGHIERLEIIADEIHEIVVSESADQQRIEALLAELDQINAAVTPLEDAFSETLSDGGRWLYATLRNSILVITALCTGFGLWFSAFIFRQTNREISLLHTGTDRVRRGDLNYRINVGSKTELGNLASTFNKMTAELGKTHFQLTSALQEQRELMESIPDVVIMLDRQGNVLKWNRKLEDVLGKYGEAIANANWISWVAPDEREKVTALLQQEVGSDDYFGIEYNITGRDGPVPFQWHGVAIRDANGDLAGLVSTGRDMRAFRRGEEERRTLVSLAEYSRDFICVASLDGFTTYVNPAGRRLVGIEPSYEISSAHILDYVSESDRQRFGELGLPTMMNEGHWEGELNLKNFKTGESIPMLVTNFIVCNPHTNQPIALATVGRDITDRRKNEEKLFFLAHHDELTGLPNRTLFSAQLSQSMADADRLGRRLAVIVLDLDDFKKVNDTLGHESGDSLLIAMAQRLWESVRRGDTVARLAGDEFAIVLADMAQTEDAEHVARKIIDTLSQPYSIAGREIFVGASLGITLFPLDSRDAGELLRNADVAMYRAKEVGKNGFQFYASEMMTKAVDRIKIESDLHSALKNDEFVLHYQPVVSCRNGRIIGAEALVRWQRPGFGLVSPNEFISIAEDTGLILPLGEWVLSTACAQLRLWQNAGNVDMHIAVNLSPRQFRQPHLARDLAHTLNSTGVAPSDLVLEITESVLAHGTHVDALLQEISATGVKFSIDDFGTGYSSLPYLKHFPISTLKIDQSFVRDIPGDANDSAIAQAIIAMAHSLEIDVIAEGVETAEQLRFLDGHRCDSMQGYFFSKPLPPEQLSALLEERREFFPSS